MKKYLKYEDHGKSRVFIITSVSQFIELTDWLFSDDKKIFRGQACDWPLVPSVGRNILVSDFLVSERQIIDEFKRESIPYLDIIPKDYWQWLAVAQHNRLPTRLLDWTENPLVALWFAVKDPAIVNKPGIVWTFNYEDTEAIFSSENQPEPFDIKQTQVYFPEHVFTFIQAQSGIFTVHHKEGDNPGRFPSMEEEIEYSEYRLAKIEIPSECFKSIRYDLLKVGVNSASLFPGLPGLVDRIRYKHMWSKDEIKQISPDWMEIRDQEGHLLFKYSPTTNQIQIKHKYMGAPRTVDLNTRQVKIEKDI